MKNLNLKIKSHAAKGQQSFLKLPPVAAFNLWYSDQNTRDRKIIKAISIFIAFCLVIVLFVQPFVTQQSAYQAKFDKSLSTYELLASNAHKFKRQTSTKTSNQPILATVSSQAKRSKINLKRFEPDGDGIRIWLEDAAFDDVALWLETLNKKHGIKIKQINVDRSDKSGLVDLRASLYK